MLYARTGWAAPKVRVSGGALGVQSVALGPHGFRQSPLSALSRQRSGLYEPEDLERAVDCFAVHDARLAGVGFDLAILLSSFSLSLSLSLLSLSLSLSLRVRVSEPFLVQRGALAHTQSILALCVPIPQLFGEVLRIALHRLLAPGREPPNQWSIARTVLPLVLSAPSAFDEARQEFLLLQGPETREQAAQQIDSLFSRLSPALQALQDQSNDANASMAVGQVLRSSDAFTKDLCGLVGKLRN